MRLRGPPDLPIGLEHRPRHGEEVGERIAGSADEGPGVDELAVTVPTKVAVPSANTGAADGAIVAPCGAASRWKPSASMRRSAEVAASATVRNSAT